MDTLVLLNPLEHLNSIQGFELDIPGPSNPPSLWAHVEKTCEVFDTGEVTPILYHSCRRS